MTTSLTEPLTDELNPVAARATSPALRDWWTWCVRFLRNWSWTIQQGFPLFRREMLVQSYRPRTYVIRAGFAVSLFLVAMAYAAVKTGTSLFSTAVRLPGQGGVILDAMIWMLFGFIYLFAPAISAGVITLEKERQTLVLLYLTKLTAWHVVLEKFFSRLVPMLTSLVLAMPLLVFSNAFGGVSIEMLVTAMWFLFVTSIQVTAVAVLCSTLCRHTTFAFVLTYLALLLIYFGPALSDIWLLDGYFTHKYISSRALLNSYDVPIAPTPPIIANGTNTPMITAAPVLPAIPREVTLLALFAPLLFAFHYGPATVGTFEYAPMLLAGYPALASALGCLVLARCFVYYRAFEDQRAPWLQRLNQFVKRFRMSRIADEQKSANSAHALPGDEPIAWRETYRSSGNWLPALLILEIPTLGLVLWLARMGNGTSEQISLVILSLWALAALLICVHSSSLITRERGQQTLELLLTTPMSSQEIIQQKFNGTRRLMLICAAPLLTAIAFQSWWRTVLIRPVAVTRTPAEINFVWWEYLITASCCVVLYLQLVGWVAMWAGLRNKNPTRATLDALAGVGFCCILPAITLGIPILVLAPLDHALGLKLVYLFGAQLSPIVMISVIEFTNLREVCSVPLLPAVVNVLVYGTLLYHARKYVLDRADNFLGRTVYY